MPAELCVVCGKICSGTPHAKDRRGRFFHRSCYDRLMQQRKAGPSAANPSGAVSSAKPASTPASQPGFVNPGDVIHCTNAACDRKFQVVRRTPLDQVGKSSCPHCGRPLAVQAQAEAAPQPVPQAIPAEDRSDRVKPGDTVCCTNVACGQKFCVAEETTLDRLLETKCPACNSALMLLLSPEPQAAAPAPVVPQSSPGAVGIGVGNVASLLDEELSPENSPHRRLVELFRLEGTAGAWDPEYQRKKQRLIYECLKEHPKRCPLCETGISIGAASCAACGLHFEGGRIARGPTAEDVQKEYADGLLTSARTKIEEERREREAQSGSGAAGEIATDIAAEVAVRLAIRLLLRS